MGSNNAYSGSSEHAINRELSFSIIGPLTKPYGPRRPGSSSRDQEEMTDEQSNGSKEEMPTCPLMKYLYIIYQIVMKWLMNKAVLPFVLGE